MREEWSSREIRNYEDELREEEKAKPELEAEAEAMKGIPHTPKEFFDRRGGALKPKMKTNYKETVPLFYVFLFHLSFIFQNLGMKDVFKSKSQQTAATDPIQTPLVL